MGKSGCNCFSSRQSTRREFAGVSGKGLAAGALAGSVLGAQIGTYGTLAQDDRTQVTWWAQDPSSLEFRESHVEAPFEEEFTNIDLVMEATGAGEDFDRVMSTALQAGTGPDIVPSQGPSHAGILAAAGLLLPLDEYAEQFNWDEKFLDWALTTGRIGGQLFQLPHQFESLMVYYGSDVFEENNWQLPTTRQELEDLATEAMDMGVIPFAAGIGDCGLCTNWYVSAFFNHYAGPGAVYQALTGEIPFSDPVFVDSIALLNDYMQRGWFGGSVQQYFATGFDDYLAQLAAGEAAMSLGGTWMINGLTAAFAETDNEWRWGQLPSLQDHVPHPLYPIGVGSTLSIAADTEVPDEAAQVLDWYFSDSARVAQRIADAQEISASGFDYMLPIPFAAGDFPPSLDPRAADIISALTEATAQGNFGYVAWTFWPTRTHVYLHDEIQRVFTGDLSPADYCQGMAEIFAEELEEGVVPPAIPRDVA